MLFIVVMKNRYFHFFEKSPKTTDLMTAGQKIAGKPKLFFNEIDQSTSSIFVKAVLSGVTEKLLR
jgi:hypothetical protein